MRRLVLALMILLLPVLARAQDAATLVADSVYIPPGGQTLIAEGNVEVFFGGTRLSAARVTFDQSTDRLTIDGPIFIATETGDIFTATQAELDPRLENGILRGARLILDGQLQLAATQMDRVDGRYTQLYQVAATSCHICSEGGTPLWEIRARRIVHDTEEQQLYFENAQFRVGGMPIFWVPRMRLPDPTLTRATGLLIPQIRTTDQLGVGIKLPYFFRLGDHRDLTLTPYISTQTTTLEALYRQAYLRGDLEVNAAVSNDTVTDDTRYYLFAEGAFNVGQDAKLRFDIEATSDTAYLLDYDYSDKDRLDSELSYERVRDRDMLQASLTYYQSLRDGSDSTTLPPVLAEASWERRTSPNFGGTLTYRADLQGHLRTSEVDTDGRDVLRVGTGVDWRATHILPMGLVIEGAAGAALDYYAVADDSTTENTGRASAYVGTTLRYPLIRQTGAVTHIIEPVVQLAWSDATDATITNEDSTSTEFDQTNLLSYARFSGEDAIETGARGALALSWTRSDPDGWSSTLTVGRVFAQDANPDFTFTSGLDTAASDWLIAGQFDLPSGLSLDARTLLADDLSVTRSEARATWSGDQIDLSATYIFLPVDADEDRTEAVSEWTIDSSYQIDDTWRFDLDARYDVAAGSPSSAGLGLGWQNECVTVDFSVSRRFTSSTTVDPSTDFGLSVGLNGFSAGRTGGTPSHRCRN